MIITAVTYRSLRTGRGYNNTSVEATAVVEPFCTADETLAKLRTWVEHQVDENLKKTEAYETMAEVNERLGSLKREEERLSKRVDAYRELLRERPKLAELARANGIGGDALLLDTI